MAEKKYYWLKLPADFFNQKVIKKLRRIAGGDTYTIIYLKMLIRSMNSNGALYYDKVEDDFATELAYDLEEDLENVKVTLSFLMAQGILVEVSEEEFKLLACQDMIGCESGSAARVRKHRANVLNSLQCNTDVTACNALVTDGNALVTTCNTEIEREKDIDIDKEIERDKEVDKEIEKESKEKNASGKPKHTPCKNPYGEFGRVKLTDDEYNKLLNEFGDRTALYIQKLDEYMETYRGARNKYTSHYMVIKKKDSWVRKEVDEQQAPKGRIDWSNV